MGRNGDGAHRSVIPESGAKVGASHALHKSGAMNAAKWRMSAEYKGRKGLPDKMPLRKS